MNIEKIIRVFSISIFTLFLINFSSFAQTIGVKGGVNVSTLVGKDCDDLEMRAGYYFGVMTQMDIISKLSFAPELLFSTQGANVKDKDEKLILSYINVPMMFRFTPISLLSVEAGPQVGLNLRSKVKEDGVSSNLATDTYNIFDVGLGVGATVDLGLFKIGARYVNGLTNVLKDNVNKNSVIQIGVSVGF
ncbi:MAG: porin family protein [Rikenellaceae bacterium]